MGPWARKHRRKIIGGVAAVGALVATIVAVVGPGSNPVPAPDRDMRLQIHNTQDIGALPARDRWCTLARSSEHCWLLQEAAGNAIDTGATAGWDLVPAGAPRQNIETNLAVKAGAAVTFSGERAVWFDDIAANALITAAAKDILPGDNLVSATIVYSAYPDALANRFIITHRGATGWECRLHTGGKLQCLGDGPTTVKYLYGETNWTINDWRCVTVVLDGRTASAGKVYLNGSDDTSVTNDLTGTGSWDGSSAVSLGNNTVPNTPLPGGIARARIDYAAITLAQHKQLCGSLFLVPDSGTTRISAGDATWTQTGGARCYPTSASAAICVPGGLVPYGYDATLAGMAIPVEPDSTNRIPFSTAIDCTNWVCNGTATATLGQVAPDSSATASTITAGDAANSVALASTGYTPSTTLRLRLWAKCSSGTLRIVSQQGSAYGLWDVACATVGGAWTLLTETHAAVTETTQFASTAAGACGLRFYAAAGSITADVWAPTLTEEPGTGVMVIPTAAAAVSTGDIAWAVDNTTGKYYRAGSGVTQTLTTIAGTCWVVDGDTLRLSGAVASECSGFWGALEIRR